MKIARPANAAAGFAFYGCADVMLSTNYPNRLAGKTVDYDAIKANAFHDQQMVIANIDDPRLDSFKRQYLRNIGQKLYG